MRKPRSDKGKKHNYPKTRKTTQRNNQPTIKQQVISILEKKKTDLEWKLKENKKILKNSVSSKRRKRVLGATERQIREIDQAIANMKNIKSRSKTLEQFAEIHKISLTMGSGFDDENVYVFDKETNFKNMILNKLQEQGIDIYNPTELNKVLKGYDIDTVIDELLESNEGENPYEEDDMVDYIGNAIKNLKSQERKVIKRKEAEDSDWEKYMDLNNPFV